MKGCLQRASLFSIYIFFKKATMCCVCAPRFEKSVWPKSWFPAWMSRSACDKLKRLEKSLNQNGKQNIETKYNFNIQQLQTHPRSRSPMTEMFLMLDFEIKDLWDWWKLCQPKKVTWKLPVVLVVLFAAHLEFFCTLLYQKKSVHLGKLSISFSERVSK